METKQQSNLIGHLMVSLVVISVFVASISYSGLWYPDAPSHPHNGVFYKDMIQDGCFFIP